MPYEDYTRQTPGRFVPPPQDTGVSLYETPPPSMYGPQQGPSFGPPWGPGGARYGTPCDQRLGMAIERGEVHPRNWGLFEFPTGRWGQAGCGNVGPGLGSNPMGGGPYGPAVPAWGRRSGVFAPSSMAEGFTSGRYAGQQTPPWVSAAYQPVTRENPHGPPGRRNPTMWASPGSAESLMEDPRPEYYGPATRNGGPPAHYSTTYPALRSQHGFKCGAGATGGAVAMTGRAAAPTANAPPAPATCGKGSGCGGSCGALGLCQMPKMPILIIMFVLLILWACALTAQGRRAAHTVLVTVPHHAGHQHAAAHPVAAKST